MINVPDTGGLCSTWADQEQFTFRGHSLELRYQTQPPHGDFIYSLTLSISGVRHCLPLWVFGRNLFFFGPSCLLVESVPAGNISGLKSAVIELSAPRYVCLDDWYCKPRITKQGLLLSRFHGGVPLLLTSSTPLAWNRFYREGVQI